MEVHLSADKEAQLIQVAAVQGRDADLLAQEVLGDYLREEAKFIAAVKLGEADFEKGDYLTQAEVEASMAQLVRG